MFAKKGPFERFATSDPAKVAEALRLTFPKSNVLDIAIPWKAAEDERLKVLMVNRDTSQALYDFYVKAEQDLENLLQDLNTKREDTKPLQKFTKKQTVKLTAPISELKKDLDKLAEEIPHREQALDFFGKVLEQLKIPVDEEDQIEDLSYHSTDLFEESKWPLQFSLIPEADCRLFTPALPPKPKVSKPAEGEEADEDNDDDHDEDYIYNQQRPFDRIKTVEGQSRRCLEYHSLEPFKGGSLTMLVTPGRIYPCKIITFKDVYSCKPQNFQFFPPLAVPANSEFFIIRNDYGSVDKWVSIKTDQFLEIEGDLSASLKAGRTVEGYRKYTITVEEGIVEYYDGSNSCW